MIRSFRFQLTVWYVALFSLLFVVFSIFLYSLLSKDLRTRLDQSLTSEANTTSALFEDELVEEKGDVPMAATEAVAGLRLHGSRVAILSGPGCWRRAARSRNRNPMPWWRRRPATLRRTWCWRCRNWARMARAPPPTA
jgi:hypothetical protein